MRNYDIFITYLKLYLGKVCTILLFPCKNNKLLIFNVLFWTEVIKVNKKCTETGQKVYNK